MASSKVRVLVVEDHALVRAGIKSMIESTPDLELAGLCESGAETLAVLRGATCDVLLCDISLPGESGIDLLAQVKSEFPAIAILMLSSHPEKHFGLNSLKAGASGYIGKGASDTELLRAIRAVGRNQRYVSPELANLLVDGVDGSTQASHASLSPRELEIFRRLAVGDSVTAIADSLELSVKTISTYRTRIMEKMGMSTNADITAYSLKNDMS